MTGLRFAVVVGIALLVGGCPKEPPLPASLSGVCGVFIAPATQKHGANQDDQDWIDDITESGVAGCGWARPAPRARPIPKKATKPNPAPPSVQTPAPAQQKREPGWWQRFRERVGTATS